MTRSNVAFALKSLVDWWTDAGAPPESPIQLPRPPAAATQGTGRDSAQKRSAKPHNQTEAPRRLKVDPIEEARIAAAGAASLDALRQAIAGFEHCDLKSGARSNVINDGVDSARVMIIGEAPGADEDRIGKPFVGRSGQLLDRMFGAIGLSREDNLYITNTIFWRPPANRAPSPAELAICTPFVERQIALVAPKLIIPVGKSAAHALLNTSDGIMRLRGRRTRYGQEGLEPIECVPILHPAYLLRRPQDKALAWKDLRLIAEICDALNLPRSSAL